MLKSTQTRPMVVILGAPGEQNTTLDNQTKKQKQSRQGLTSQGDL